MSKRQERSIYASRFRVCSWCLPRLGRDRHEKDSRLSRLETLKILNKGNCDLVDVGRVDIADHYGRERRGAGCEIDATIRSDSDVPLDVGSVRIVQNLTGEGILEHDASLRCRFPRRGSSPRGAHCPLRNHGLHSLRERLRRTAEIWDALGKIGWRRRIRGQCRALALARRAPRSDYARRDRPNLLLPLSSFGCFAGCTAELCCAKTEPAHRPIARAAHTTRLNIV